MIDICPVGALTSKPFRYSARTWELSRRKSISPHDSTGANLIIQVKNNKVMRVVPLENEEINECWLADRDRFSYEALSSEDRLTSPMIKQGGAWKAVDWQTALEYVANGLKQVSTEFGASSLGALVSPSSTVEELFLTAGLIKGLGSQNIDYRLRHGQFAAQVGARYLGCSIASLSELQRVLVVGSNLRKDHPLFAQRIRQATRKGCAINVISAQAEDWAMPITNRSIVHSGSWVLALAKIAAAVAAEKSVNAPVTAQADDVAIAMAKSLLAGERKAILLGNAAAHHSNASSLLALANWIAQETGATIGYLTESANTVGAQIVGALPGSGGKNAGEMLQANGSPKAMILLNTEPEFDSAAGVDAVSTLAKAQMVVTLSPFKANMAFSDVLLPIAPFTETSGTFINAEGRMQSFHAVVKPLGETRPAWKVLRVLANMMDLPGFTFDSSQEVLAAVPGLPSLDKSLVSSDLLSNVTGEAIDLSVSNVEPCVATIYALDSLVRRSPALQLTVDAQAAKQPQEIAA